MAVGKGPEPAADPAKAGESLAQGLRSLYGRAELCDMYLVACGERFPVHKAMLAAMSDNFRDYLRVQQQRSASDAAAIGVSDPMGGLLAAVSTEPAPAPAPALAAGGVADATATVAGVAAVAAPGAVAAAPGIAGAVPAPAGDAPAGTPAPAEPTQSSAEAAPSTSAAQGAETAAPPPRKPAFLELQVSGVTTAEALRTALSYVYGVGTGAPWEYAPSNSEVNKDVLRLARHFGLPHLHEHAARWLAKGLTTVNVVERLVTCEEFGLGLLREKIMEQLTKKPAELATVSSSAEIMRHPRILQDLLMHVASFARAGAVAAAAAAEKEKAEKEKAAAAAAAAEKEPEPERAPEKPPVEAAAAPGAKRERERPQEKPEKEKLAGRGHEKVVAEPRSKKAKRGAAGA